MLNESNTNLKAPRRSFEGPAKVSRRSSNSLSVAFLKALKKADPPPSTKRYFDSLGLFIEARSNGGLYWRLKFYFPKGKERRMSFGVYPEVTLKEARERRDEARALIRIGVDPVEQQKAVRASDDASGDIFEVIAREWHSKFMAEKSESHRYRNLRLLERDLFPHIGKKPITEITAPMLLAVARRKESSALETAHRGIRIAGQVFRYAIATGRAERDISQDLKGSLPPPKKGHFSAVVEPDELRGILRLLRCYPGSPQVQAALKLQPLLACRPGELRTMLWADVDLEAAQWRFTLSKTAEPHIVPLATQAVEILRDLHLITRKSRFVFPGARSIARPMSDNAVLCALRSMDIPKDKVTGHGFRATFRTILDEVLEVREDFIEHQLGHSVKGPNGRAYNRTKFLPQRTEMMQQWADYLDALAG